MDILGVGFPELVVILIIAMMIFGPRRLPELVAKVGKTVADLRKMSEGMMLEWQREITIASRLDEFKETRKELEEAGQVIGQVKKDIGQVQQKIGDQIQKSLDQAQKDVAVELPVKQQAVTPSPSQDDGISAPLTEEKSTKTEPVSVLEQTSEIPEPNGNAGSPASASNNTSDSVTPTLPSKPKEVLNE